MSIVSIAAATTLYRGGKFKIDHLPDEHTYVAVFTSHPGWNTTVYERLLDELKAHTNVLFVGPKAINIYHGGTEKRQYVVIFEKKCQEPSVQSPVPAA